MMNATAATLLVALGVYAQRAGAAPEPPAFAAVVAVVCACISVGISAALLTAERSTNIDADYPVRTWRDFAGNPDFEKLFRFSEREIPRLIAAMELPAVIKTACRRRFSDDQAISVLLYRLSQRCTYLGINKEFGLKRSAASALLNWTYEYLHTRWYKPLFVTDFKRWAPFFPEWAAAVHAKSGYEGPDGVPWFVDGSLHEVAQPEGQALQAAYFNFSKWTHANLMQGCLAVCGIIIDCAGPCPGAHNDQYILNWSRLLSRFKSALEWAAEQAWGEWDWPHGRFYGIGDAGYARSILLHVPFKNVPGLEMPRAQRAANLKLSRVRIPNEWIFGRIEALFPMVEEKDFMQTAVVPVAKIYICAAMLTNAHTCLRGNATSQYFGVRPPTLEWYFDSAPQVEACPPAWYELPAPH